MNERLEYLRNKLRPKPPEPEEVQKMSMDEALIPYLESMKDLSNAELLRMGGSACCCMGPRTDRDPDCPCGLRIEAQKRILASRGLAER